MKTTDRRFVAIDEHGVAYDEQGEIISPSVADQSGYIAELESEINAILTDARAGLTPIPTPGAEWLPTARYTPGDTVTLGGVEYEALRYSRGQSPDTSSEHWRLVPTEPVYPAWADIADGTVITEGMIVTHDGVTWLCASQHIKSTVYKPKAGSSKWAVYTG